MCTYHALDTRNVAHPASSSTASPLPSEGDSNPAVDEMAGTDGGEQPAWLQLFHPRERLAR
jgi:hypothetical protein